MVRLAYLPAAKQPAKGIIQSNGVLTRGKVRDMNWCMNHNNADDTARGAPN